MKKESLIITGSLLAIAVLAFVVTLNAYLGGSVEVASVNTQDSRMANAILAFNNTPAGTAAGGVTGIPIPGDSSKTCRAAVSFDTAPLISNSLQLSAAQKASLMSAPRLHLVSTLLVRAIIRNSNVTTVNGVRTVTPINPPIIIPGYTDYVFDLCFDSNYISNVPAGLDTAQILSLNSSSTQDVKIPLTGTSASSTATSTVTYSVSVDYDKFTSEAAANRYVSVYTTTGTKTVSVAVIKFAAGSSFTAMPAIAQLSTLGYRPATMSELYALKTAQSSVGANVVGLGTNLGGAYGYPTGHGQGSAGMGHNAGPFNTTSWSFAAVLK